MKLWLIIFTKACGPCSGSTITWYSAADAEQNILTQSNKNTEKHFDMMHNPFINHYNFSRLTCQLSGSKMTRNPLTSTKYSFAVNHHPYRPIPLSLDNLVD